MAKSNYILAALVLATLATVALAQPPANADVVVKVGGGLGGDDSGGGGSGDSPPAPAPTTSTTASSAPTTTPAPPPAAPVAPPVPLGTAGDFVILTKSGISTVPASDITGDIGVSPITGAAMTGFSLVAHSSNTYSTSSQITGKAYAADYAAPTPSKMTTAISDMETAYTDAAGRSVSSESNLNIKSGLISGTTFTAGVYKWDSDVMFDTDIYIKGSSSDHFIFQITGNFIAGSGAKIVLVDDGTGGGKPTASNMVWQLAGYVDAGTTSHLEGIVLGKTYTALKTGSSLNGRILAQTASTLDKATITQPQPDSQ